MLRRRRGFTLIELLVVIAIIGILAAMLFPVFARARESARKVQCLANVKNIALAVQMYLTDYDRFWPNLHDASFEQQVADIAGKDSYADCGIGNRFNPYLRPMVILDEYIKNRQVWKCPSAKWDNDAGTIVPQYGSQTVYDWWIINGGFGPTAWENGYGACENPFPPGWGGGVTDSFLQQTSASQRSSRAGDGRQFLYDYEEITSLREQNTGQLGDPAKIVVVADAANRVWTSSQIAFPDICGVSGCGLCGGGGVAGCGCAADWENCSWTQECSIDKVTMLDPFRRDSNMRKQYTRHMGGSNLGFADGHAKWSPAEAILTESGSRAESPAFLGFGSLWPAWPDCPPVPR